MLIAVAHVTLVWLGDILHLYALLGLLLLPFLRRKPKTIIIWAACLFGLPVLVTTIYGAVKILTHAPPAGTKAFSEEKLAEVRVELERAVRTYGHGTWLEIARLRIKDFLDLVRDSGPWAVHDFGLFLLGLFSWKRGVFHRPADYRGWFKRIIV